MWTLFEVDPRFRQGGAAARSRRRRRLAARIALFGLLPMALLGAGVFMFTDLPGRIGTLAARWPGAGDADAALVQLDDAADIAPLVRANVFIDIPGDPAVLRFDEDDRRAGIARAEGSGVLDIQRFGLPRPDRFTVIRDDLVRTEQRLMIQLPSSREDFALFVSERDRAETESAQRAATPDAALQAELEALESRAELDGGYEGDGAAAGTGALAMAAPRNTGSVATVRREADRPPLYRDLAIRTAIDRPAAVVLTGNGLSEAAARAALGAIGPVLPLPDPLPRGAVLGLRLQPASDGTERLSQISLYLDDTHAGTALLDERGAAVVATDPWLGRDLPALARADDRAERSGAEDGQGRWRLLDAIYSAAVRDGVPAALAGELITILSQSIDLERTAAAGDRVTLAFSAGHGPGGRASGQWLYAGTDGPSGRIDCYVMPDGNGGYRCAATAGEGGAAAAPRTGRFHAPVRGVMTSRFGPRNHPVLKTTRLHAGVDWAAPVGTPVRAAVAGKVAMAGNGDGYGKLVVLTHPDGFETRYAHLDRFAPGLKPGDIIQPGQEIGTVGLTGLTTGAHLHFELRRGGQPVDPLPWLTGGPLAGSDAVEALVARIIEVESANVATAQNPNSTATGLGQFVEQTWLRMMGRYRPDLVAAMSTADLLALRNDPTLSREMVRQLARDNEAHLRDAGHEITPGRLYLAHFLGAEGASRVLRADNGKTVPEVMGARVVSANGFLAGYTIADLKTWADRKMHGMGVPAHAPTPAPPPPEVAAFIALVDETLAATEG